jgi:mono/diheme cytochrome c family protein
MAALALALLAGLAWLAAPARLDTRDPLDGTPRAYRGVPLERLLPAGQGDAVLIRCGDGFVVLVPLATVRRERPLLADAEGGPAGFDPIAPPRGPRTVVWPPGARGVTSEDWAWNVIAIERVDLRAYLAALEPEPASPQARRGREVYFGSCFHCHAVHGAGGNAGWDFAEPTPLWRYLDDRAVARYLRDPRAVNPDGHMPPQPLTARQRRDLLAYLHAVIR